MPDSPYIVSPDQLIAENIFLTSGKREVVKGGTISAAQGRITGLLGRNGAGKSTMLNAIFGTGKADVCDVFVNGVKIQHPYQRHRLINYLPQHPFLLPLLSVKKSLKQYDIDPEKLTGISPEFGPFLEAKVNDLSGGMERLLSVLIILLADTRYSMLDEPFSHIMPLHIQRLQSLMREQKKFKGIIVTDHQYEHLLEISDTIYLMKDGQSILIRHPDDLVVHGYINSP